MRTLVAVLALPLLAFSAELATKKTLTLAAAKEIAAAAEKVAVENKWTVVIAILDDGANLIYLQKADETQIGSIAIAQAKGATAIKMKRPSKVLEDAVAGGRNAVLSIPGVLPIEGGLPIVVEGKIIGAIGVSGVTSAQDGIVAKAGADYAATLK